MLQIYVDLHTVTTGITGLLKNDGGNKDERMKDSGRYKILSYGKGYLIGRQTVSWRLFGEPGNNFNYVF